MTASCRKDGSASAAKFECCEGKEPDPHKARVRRQRQAGDVFEQPLAWVSRMKEGTP